MRTPSRADRGYTLIELVVTLIVIGVLASIATVSYNRQRDDVAGVEATRTLNSLAEAQRAQHSIRGKFLGAVAGQPTALRTLESSVETIPGALDTTGTGAAGVKAAQGETVSVALGPVAATPVSVEAVGLAVLTKAQECYTLVSFPETQSSTTWPDDRQRFKPGAGAPCSGAEALRSYQNTGRNQW